jgi:hypothetical protein
MKVYLELCESDIILGLGTTKGKCNQEHSKFVVVLMFSYKNPIFVHFICVHAHVQTRSWISLNLVVFVRSVQNNFSSNYRASFSHEYKIATRSVDIGFDTHEQVIPLHTHQIYKVEYLWCGYSCNMCKGEGVTHVICHVSKNCSRKRHLFLVRSGDCLSYTDHLIQWNW